MNAITVEIKNYVTRQLADIILHAVDEEDFNARMQELTAQLDKEPARSRRRHGGAFRR